MWLRPSCLSSKENKQLLESEIIFQLQIWSGLVVRGHKCAGRTRWTWNNPMWTLGWTKNGWCSKTIREISSWQTCQLMKWEKQFSSLPFPSGATQVVRWRRWTEAGTRCTWTTIVMTSPSSPDLEVVSRWTTAVSQYQVFTSCCKFCQQLLLS